MKYNGKDTKLKQWDSVYEHLNEYFIGWWIITYGRTSHLQASPSPDITLVLLPTRLCKTSNVESGYC
jgi:hypothetical protein